MSNSCLLIWAKFSEHFYKSCKQYWLLLPPIIIHYKYITPLLNILPPSTVGHNILFSFFLPNVLLSLKYQVHSLVLRKNNLETFTKYVTLAKSLTSFECWTQHKNETCINTNTSTNIRIKTTLTLDKVTKCLRWMYCFYECTVFMCARASV